MQAGTGVREGFNAQAGRQAGTAERRRVRRRGCGSQVRGRRLCDDDGR